MSDKLCGYLRHIESGTCVGKNENSHLIASATSCSDSHFFCLNTTTQLIRNGFPTGSGEIVCKKDPQIAGLCSKVRQDSTWRLTKNRQIQLSSSSSDLGSSSSETATECWDRQINSGLIQLLECLTLDETKDNTMTKLKRQRFDFHSMKAGNYRTVLSLKC